MARAISMFRMTWRVMVALLILVPLPSVVLALGQEQYVETSSHSGDFTLAERNAAAPLYVDANDSPGVVRAVRDLQADIQRVTNCIPPIVHDGSTLAAEVVLVGTLGKSQLINRLVRDQVIDVPSVAGKRESFLIQV